MGEVRDICPAEPDFDVIQNLEELLEDAKAGGLVEIVCIARARNGDISHINAGETSDAYAMIGALDVEKYEYRELYAGIEIEFD